MSQVRVRALSGFEHGGKVTKGQFLVIDDQHALKLASNGLIEIVRNKVDMKKKELSFASPVAQVSLEKTVKRSGSGGKKARKSKDLL